MATNVHGQSTRDLVTQQVHYLRLKVLPTPGVFQPFSALIPNGANILRVSNAVRTTFNGTSPTFSLGWAGAPTAMVNAASAASALTQGRSATLPLVAATGVSMTADRRLGVTLAGAGMSAGDLDCEVEYTINNDR